MSRDYHAGVYPGGPEENCNVIMASDLIGVGRQAVKEWKIRKMLREIAGTKTVLVP